LGYDRKDENIVVEKVPNVDKDRIEDTINGVENAIKSK